MLVRLLIVTIRIMNNCINYLASQRHAVRAGKRKGTYLEGAAGYILSTLAVHKSLFSRATTSPLTHSALIPTTLPSLYLPPALRASKCIPVFGSFALPRAAAPRLRTRTKARAIDTSRLGTYILRLSDDTVSMERTLGHGAPRRP